MRVFVDTNLWVYRLDQRDIEKSRKVGVWLRELASTHEIVVSTQVLIELRAVVTRKLQPPLPFDDTRIALAVLAKFDVVSTDANLVLDAHELAQAEQISWFDALIVEAAIRSRCSMLYSEDLGHGRKFGSLTVRNPLLPVSDSPP
jgi:predicted nucleic acid-binding protein